MDAHNNRLLRRPDSPTASEDDEFVVVQEDDYSGKNPGDIFADLS